MAQLPEFLTSKHAIYEKMRPTWEKNERRLRGGSDVTSTDLSRWDSEEVSSDQYKNRKDRACYLNFMAEFMTQIRGHLDMKFPEVGTRLNYGSLGAVDEKDAVTKADILHNNADGVGIDGSSIRDFFMDAVEWGGATGHRWIMSTRPPLTAQQRERVNSGGSLTAEDEKAGQRPYLADWSPLMAPNWYYENGVLQWIRLEYDDTSPHVGKDGKITTESRKVILLYVRRGYGLFGAVVGRGEGSDALYADGGWWKYNEDGLLIDSGNLELTNGDIPVSALVVKRDRMYFSRPITTELGQIAASFMNIDSAADHDAIVAGSRRLILKGVSSPAQSIFVGQIKQGSLSPAIPESADQKFPIEVIDAAGITANEALETRMQKKMVMAERVAMQEVTAAPTASGEARRVEYAAKKSPLLAQIASGLETCMTTTIRFVQMMWGEVPDATVKWDREFDLIPLVEDIRSSFTLMRDAGLSSASVKAKLIVQDLREKGLISEDGELDEEAIIAELKASAERTSQGDALFANLGLG
jgi:hypothetical protein